METKRKQKALAAVFNNIPEDLPLPKEAVDRFMEYIGNGFYDVDEQGEAYEHWSEGITRLQRDVNFVAYALKNQSVTPPAPTTPTKTRTQLPAPAPINSALLAPGPDTTTSGIVTPRSNDSDITEYQRALKSGKQISSDEVDRITAQWLRKNGE